MRKILLQLLNLAVAVFNINVLNNSGEEIGKSLIKN